MTSTMLHAVIVLNAQQPVLTLIVTVNGNDLDYSIYFCLFAPFIDGTKNYSPFSKY